MKSEFDYDVDYVWESQESTSVALNLILLLGVVMLCGVCCVIWLCIRKKKESLGETEIVKYPMSGQHVDA